MQPNPNDRRPQAHTPVPPAGGYRDAIDADDIEQLKINPSDPQGRLDISIDESFPASDPPSQTQPKKGKSDPPPGGKYE